MFAPQAESDAVTTGYADRHWSVTWAPTVPESLRDIVRSVRRCLRCNYLLEGLPEAHRCPECGTDYDGLMFEVARRREVTPRVVSLILLGVGVMGIMTGVVAFFRHSIDAFGPLWIGFLVGVIGFGLYPWRRQYYLTSAGFTTVMRSEYSVVDWSDVRDVRVRPRWFRGANLLLTVPSPLPFPRQIKVRMLVRCDRRQAPELERFMRGCWRSAAPDRAD